MVYPLLTMFRRSPMFPSRVHDIAMEAHFMLAHDATAELSWKDSVLRRNFWVTSMGSFFVSSTHILIHFCSRLYITQLQIHYNFTVRRMG
jgi:hypothetical protein